MERKQKFRIYKLREAVFENGDRFEPLNGTIVEIETIVL